MTAKPWQIAVIIIGLLVAGGLLYYQLSSSSDPLPHESRLIDVVTGDVFDLNTKSVGQVMLPAAHPDTGTRTLVRIREVEPGKWVVPDRDLVLVKELAKTVDVKAVDVNSGELTGPIGTVRTYRKHNG